MPLIFDENKFDSIAGYVLSGSQQSGLSDLWTRMQADPSVYVISYAAYMLATVEHECARTWRPVTEAGSLAYFEKYETGHLARQLGNTQPGDGYKYRGRGYVQITGWANYKKFERGMTGLLDDPDRTLVPRVAYWILSVGMQLGWFTGHKLSDYCTVDKADYIGARRVVNGQDDAQEIAARAEVFASCITKVGA